MKFVIECEGVIYGPFATEREAAEWALSHRAVPWRLRSIHTTSQQDRSGDD